MLFKFFFVKFAGSDSYNSFANRLRRKRCKLFFEIVDKLSSKLNRPLNILDIGGTENFWKMLDSGKLIHQITLLNKTFSDNNNNDFVKVVGDARDMKNFSANQFDIIFSNSVIEHLGSFENQKKMAEEVKSLSKNFFIQTLFFYFPLEPHFGIPFYHWFPKKLRIWLIMHFDLGWYKKIKDKEAAALTVSKIRLLKKSELKLLFPNATIKKEKFLGFTKSYLVIRIDE